ncbi:MAG TPA: metallophosphoesterase family protein [Methylomirabilota bacterium]|nr:metallophosphoesterase family protein [Methylomirabilota bacterium]
MLDRRRFLAATPLALVAAGWPARLAGQPAQPTPPVIGRSSRLVAGETRAVPVVTTASAHVGRILQLTDLHFYGKTRAEDEQTKRDLNKLVERTSPDLLAVTGDLWHDNPSGQGFARMESAVKQIDGLGVPWAFCWGNHDQLDDYQRGHDLLEQTRNGVYRGALTHGDYRLELATAREPKTPRADLLFLNSSNVGLGAWQLNWFRATTLELKSKRPHALPVFAFFHIPILEYRTLFQPGTNSGLQLEKVCHEEESGAALPELVRPETLRACFCGHDHLNDYTARAGKLDLVYGRATGHGGYGGEVLKKGGKLIEIDLARGDYEQTTVFADGARWRPSS